MIPRTRSRFLVCCLTAALSMVLGRDPLHAQYPYGAGSAGVSGEVPELSSPQAWMPNPAFGLAIDDGVGGGLGFIFLSLGPSSFSFGAITALVDPVGLFSTAFIGLSGTPGQAGAGSGVLAIALPPENPAFAGRSVFAQAVVVHPLDLGLSATQGLEIEFALHPQVFAGTSVGGSADPYFLVEAQSGTVENSGASSFTDNVNGAAYAHGGKDLFVISAITRRINHADLSGGTPAWSLFRQLGTSASAAGLAFDRERERLWCLGDPGSAKSELIVLDADPTSPTLGQPLGNTTGLGGGGLIERWSLSPTGNRAAVLEVLGGKIFVVDTDPASPNFLQTIQSLSVPQASSAISLNSQCAFRPDDSELLVLVQHAGSQPGELARYHFESGLWLDHNTLLPGVQNLGEFSAPPIALGAAPTCLRPSPTGSFALLSGFGTAADGASGWAGRLDLGPSGVALGAWTPVSGVSIPNAWGCDVNFDGGRAAITSWTPEAATLHFFATGTMQQTGTAPLSTASNIYTVRWR